LKWLTVNEVVGGACGSHGGASDERVSVKRLAVVKAVALPVASSVSLLIGLGLDGGVVVATVNLVP
jgi:hypothetical protein